MRVGRLVREYLAVQIHLIILVTHLAHLPTRVYDQIQLYIVIGLIPRSVAHAAHLLHLTLVL